MFFPQAGVLDFTSPACFVSPQAIAKKLVKAGIEPQTLCSILSQAFFSQTDDDVKWLSVLLSRELWVNTISKASQSQRQFGLAWSRLI